MMKGVGLRAIQELLGHADLGMAIRYAHLSQGHLLAPGLIFFRGGHFPYSS